MFDEKFSDAYLELRTGTRSLLSGLDIPSNPAVGNGWIVDRLREKAGLLKSELSDYYEDEPGDDFILFQSSLMQILDELIGQPPEIEDESDPLEAKRLVWILHGLLINDESWEVAEN